MLEKEKGPVLGKLRTIQLIEADFQLIMRIFLGYRMEKSIESNTRISKFNFRLRKGYSIDEAIFKKYLLCDTSMHTK